MPGSSSIIPSGSRDTALGPTDASSQSSYGILCPIFDTRPPLTQDGWASAPKTVFRGGNFINDDLKIDPFAIPGFVIVLNIPKLPVYNMDQDYGYSDADFGVFAPDATKPDLVRTANIPAKNWTRLTDRLEPLLKNRKSILDFIRRSLVAVRRNEITTTPDAQKLVAEIRSPSTGIDPLTSEAFMVIPPGYNQRGNKLLEFRLNELYGTRPTLNVRLRRD